MIHTLWASALATTLAACLWLHLDRLQLQRDLAQARQAAAQTRAQAAEAAVSATIAYRGLEARWQATQETLDRDARARQSSLRAAAGGAAVAGDGLRLRAAATAAAACGGAPAAASAATSSGPPASSPAAMLADVLGRVEEAARQLAEVADARGLAGASCERAYDEMKGRD